MMGQDVSIGGQILMHPYDGWMRYSLNGLGSALGSGYTL